LVSASRLALLREKEEKKEKKEERSSVGPTLVP